MSKRNKRLFITAASAKQTGKDCYVIAYTGGLMTVPGWGLIGIELSGLDISGQVKLLCDHDPSLKGVVGYGTAAIEGSNLTITGKIIEDTKAGEDIISLSKSGFQFEASVGIEARRVKYIEEDEEEELNGAKIKSSAAWTKILEGVLREVSITSLGCDSETVVSIAAKYEGNKNQNSFEKEKNMFAKLQAMAAGYADVLDKSEIDSMIVSAMEKNLDEAGFGQELNSKVKLIAMRASRPQTAPMVNANRSNSLDEPDVIRAAAISGMLVAGGLEKAAIKSYGQKTVDLAKKHDWCNPYGLCAAALLLENKPIPTTPQGLIRAAFSSVGLPILLSDSMNKAVGFAYQQSPQTFRPFTKIKPLNNFLPTPQANLSLDMTPLPLGPVNEVKHGDIDEEALPSIRAETFARLIKISMQSFVNDSLGVFANLPEGIAGAALRGQSDHLYQTLLSNANSFFSLANNNFLTGSALGIDALSSAIQAFRNQVDPRGYPTDIVPRFLIVGPENESTARAIIASTELARYTSSAKDLLPVGNPIMPLELIVEPRLSNANFSGVVSGTWFLSAEASSAPITLGFVGGVEAPLVEFFGPESDINTFGYSWRVSSHYGASLVNSRAIVKAIIAEA